MIKGGKRVLLRTSDTDVELQGRGSRTNTIITYVSPTMIRTPQTE